MRKALGYYVINSAGEEVAWHKTRAGARKICFEMARKHPGIFWTTPQYEKAA
jgi:DNA primase